MKKSKIFLTYFNSFQDFHFYKDPGQIPFRFKKVFGYDSYILTTTPFNQLKETKKYLDIIVLPTNGFKRYKEFIKFFYQNRGSIKIINIFHISFNNIFIAWLCKLIVPNVFIYLKMDNCVYTGPYPWEKIFDKNVKPNEVFPYENNSKLISRFKNFILKKYLIKVVDLFSVEDDFSRDYFESKYSFFKNKIVTVYNGHTVDLFNTKKDDEYKKENIILNVGNLGTFSKATDVLMQAYTKNAHKNDWQLHLAGKIAEPFKSFLHEYFLKYPQLKKRIFFHGNLEKIELFTLYRKAKIFCLPSRFEGFANVFSEAMYFSNAIITTKDVSPRKIIEDKAGLIVEKDNVKQLAEAMQYLIERPELIKKYGEYGGKFAREYLKWDYIIKKLYSMMINHGYSSH